MNPITRQHWARIEAVLDQALDLEGDDLARFLEIACLGDPQLRSDVDVLMSADRAATGFLETPAAHLSGVRQPIHTSDGEDTPGAEAGERIGSYRLVRKLGHGGMGTVYVADRADGQFEQRVALKLIRGGVTNDDVRRRFLQERQILAGLRHRNIARLMDGGVTPDGRPYFVMEYIEGVPITRYCDERQLGIDPRLRLFGHVCDAVRYAHDSRVVHRDLKPANILVTTTGELKLLDFGIAKPLDEQAGEATPLTRAGMHVLTPEYAAPEQVRCQPITTATDVYALGVVLYELLTGHRPYRFAGQSPVEIERVVCEREPPRPSTRVTRAEEFRHTDGRIETITPENVSRARDTVPDRLRRQLSGDLDKTVLRAMAKDPVRRYASVTALSNDVVRYLEGRPVLARRGAAGYRIRKLARRHRAGLIIGAFAALVGGTASTLIVTRPAQPVGDPRPDGAHTTSVVAQSLHDEGLRAYHQNDFHAARRLFRAALAEDSTFPMAAYYALATEWALSLPPDSALQVRLRRLANRLPGRKRLIVRGRIALSTADPALLHIADTLTTRYPDEPEGHFLLGRALVGSGDFLRGLPHLRKVVSMDSLGLRGGSAACRACDALSAMISTYTFLDSLPAAERTARDWVRVQPGSARPWHVLAGVLDLQSRTEEALSAIRRAGRLEPGHPYVPIYPALLEIRTGEFEAADRLLREHARAGRLDVQTEALWFLIISLRYQGRVREALATARRLRRLRTDRLEPQVAEAQVLFEMGRHREAAALFDSLADFSGQGDFGRLPSVLATSRSWHLVHAADARAAAGDTAGLQVMADTIEALGSLTIGGMRRRLHHHVRGLLLTARGDTEEAAREFYRATFWPVVPSSGFTRTNLELGRALLALERPEEAVRVLQPALRLGLEAASFYLTHTELHELIGRAFQAAGQQDSARVHYRWVLNRWENADPRFHARRDTVTLRLAALER